MKAHQPGALVLGAETGLHYLTPNLPGGAVLGDLFEKIVVRVEEEAQARTELVHVEAAAPRPFDIFDTVVEREREFLQGGRAGLANVISADGNGVEARRELRSELKRVDHQAHRRRRRIDVFLLRDVFLENVVLNRAGNFLPVCALLFRDDQIHGPQHRRRRVDGHRDRGLFQIDAAEKNFHVFERIDGHAALADLAFAGGMVGVVAHQRGQIEGDGESAAAMLQQIFVALVGLLGRGEAGELPHGEKLAAISGGVNAARVGWLAGIAEIVLFAPILGQIGLRVEAANGHAGNRGEARMAVLVEIYARGRADGSLGRFFESGGERFLGPLFFGFGGMTVLKNVGDRTFGDLRLVGWTRRLLWHANPGALVR